ncbi:alpha beta-hydrolase [Mycena floridula]|nr:alpha beta-hydrolase [Mycena floridula]
MGALFMLLSAMYRLALSSVFLTCISLQSTLVAGTSPRPIIDVGNARYQGVFNATTNITRFLGVHYAASTSGTKRFTAPQAPSKVQEIVQATDFPALCPNGLIGEAPVDAPWLNPRADPVDPEDCLLLNIHIPGALTPGRADLPVLVYLHAGGYIFGGASLYPGDDVAKRGVVYVGLQHRVGLFGFLAGEKVHKGGVLNAGLLDQQFALQWIQKHISLFGGDPSKVTLWGDSAGGGAVVLHTVANNGKTRPQLFRTGIGSSTYLPPQYPFNHRIPEAIYAEVVSRANCSTATDTLACLRSTDEASLEAINAAMGPEALYGTAPFLPVIDGKFISQRPTISLKQGKVNGNGLLSIHNTDEGKLFTNKTHADLPGANLTSYINNLLPDLDAKNVKKVLQLYKPLGSIYNQEKAILGEAIFICPAYFMLEAFPGRSYKGEFAIGEARHLDDIPYLFSTINMLNLEPYGTPPQPVYNNTDYLKAFAGAFINYATTSNPNKKLSPDITPAWPLWSESGRTMVFNRTESNLPSVKAVVPPQDQAARCA